MDMDNIPSNPAASQLELPHSKVILPARPLPPQFASWAAVKVPRNLAVWARIVSGLFFLFFLTLVFVPWTQTIGAQGSLSAYSPVERPQLIHAPIEARVHSWHVDEGVEVRKNDLLLELIDVDPQFMAPDLLVRLDQSIQALEDRREAALSRAYLLEEQIDEMTQLKKAALDAAGSRVQEATNRIRSAEQRFEAAKVGALTARLNLERSHILEAEGLISRRDLELAIQDGAAAQAELKASDAALDEVTQSRQALAHARARIEAELVQQLLNIRGQRAAALEEAARASKEIADLTLTRSNASERRIAGRITSPIDGTVVRMKRVGSGEIVRLGDPLMTVVPATAIRAVEMWADPLDAPLLTPGRQVRLLFQGIPAIPLPAWPSFMAGTYNGRILVVDQSSDEQRGFRFWVAPDPQLRAWPPQNHVRQGTPVMG
jgi:multidrug efflux pump subunit AcrA (membrane-fusion protein)